MLKKEHFLKWKILSSISNATSKANPKHFNKTPNPQTFPFHLRDYFKLRDEHSGQHLHSTVSSAAWKGGGGLPRGSAQLPSQLPHELGTASNHHDFEQQAGRNYSDIRSDAFSGCLTGDFVAWSAELPSTWNRYPGLQEPRFEYLKG